MTVSDTLVDAEGHEFRIEFARLHSGKVKISIRKGEKSSDKLIAWGELETGDNPSRLLATWLMGLGANG